MMESLDRAMGALPPRDRRLLWLCDVRRLPTSRISAITGIKPQTLRVRRYRARMQIARKMREPEAQLAPDPACENAARTVGGTGCGKRATWPPPIASMGRAS
jgi:hypothetical protein